MPKLLVNVQVSSKDREVEGQDGPIDIQKIYPEWPVPEIGSSWAMDVTEDYNLFKVEEVVHYPDKGYVLVGLEDVEQIFLYDLLESNSGWVHTHKK